MNVLKLIDLLNQMPKSAEVYFETQYETNKGEFVTIVRKADFINCQIEASEENITKEVTILSYTDVEKLYCEVNMVMPNEN